jgi:hypothetical protein
MRHVVLRHVLKQIYGEPVLRCGMFLAVPIV